MSAVTLDTGDRIFAGILLTGFAYFLFTVHDSMVKLLVAAIPVWQVLFFRSLTILTGCLIFGGRQICKEAWHSPVFRSMFLRSILMLAAWLCFYTAARELQLAELTTIYYAAPIIVTVLSILVLGEKVPLTRWAAVAIGFVGVFVACDPAKLGLSLPVLLVLSAACLWGLSIVLLRKIALQEKTIVQMVLNNGFSLLTAGLPLTLLWMTPSLSQVVLLAATGLVAGFAQFTLYEGMKRAPASVIAPFEYTALVWAFLLGFLIWGDVPRSEVFVGASMIVGAGLIIIAGERFRRRA
ncbi:DMT family transporter [Mesorhizobium sp. BAC0120]|uniref:DMT family transporter n=1 Tax=Mesorhizobium sp. BAC0120 TaxID=3090670 RepID=UPI00298C37C4|nr:DMT family transporter [Mesorhizobium sp. BAC0120]MDW6021248.1 DMT family transporter [Mesorhizobium sp. BAC0120]